MDLNGTASFRLLNNRESLPEKRYGYERITNEKILSGDSSASRVNFEAKEYYNEIQKLSLTTPIWKNEGDNPIFHYVAKGTSRYAESVPSSVRHEDFGKRKLELDAGAAEFFQTTFKKEDCARTKARLAREDPVSDAYSVPHDHMFRELYMPIERPDFKVRLSFATYLAEIQVSAAI